MSRSRCLPISGERQQWLPPGKSAAVCFSIDDIHPGTFQDAYEAGGELQNGALGMVRRLQLRHGKLKTTLCVTPDWRLNSLVPDTRVLRHIPGLAKHVHWTRRHPPDRFRLDRHPALVEYLNSLERCEVVVHGLTHSHRGPKFAVEFQEQTVEESAAIVQRGVDIFTTSGVKFVPGFIPPAWNAPDALIEALGRLGFEFVSSARDIKTVVEPGAVTAMSGRHGVSLIYPQRIGEHGLIHLSVNFQATSPVERATTIVELGGVLHIKAHIFKAGGGHVMRDGLDELYCNYLDMVFLELDRRYGDRLWWAHLSEVAEYSRRSL